MDSGKKFNYKKLLLPAAFVVLLLLTIFLKKQADLQDKEALGTEVYVRVTEIRTGGSKFNPGGLNVTVSYKGEAYKLHGVPSNAHFKMKNSKNYHSDISAVLYNGELYYDSTCIHPLAEKFYFASLAAAYFTFILLIGGPLLNRRQKNTFTGRKMY